MDIRMPEIDGLAATRTIRAGQGPNSSARIVALTADVEPENLAACREAGIDGVLPKPISPEQLLAEVCGFGRTTGRASRRA
jgi:CheY-like chemotaxis protein